MEVVKVVAYSHYCTLFEKKREGKEKEGRERGEREKEIER